MGKVSESKCNHMIEGLFHLPTKMKQPYGYKFRDRSRCQSCGMLQPKSQNEPDYLMALIWGLIEVKGPHKAWNWRTGEPISETQRARLEETKGWLFLELGEGNRPKRMQAFLIPWFTWTAFEKVYEMQGKKSITLEGTKRLPSAREDFADYMLEWKDARWIVPSGHTFWGHLGLGLLVLNSYIKEIMDHNAERED